MSDEEEIDEQEPQEDTAPAEEQKPKKPAPEAPDPQQLFQELFKKEEYRQKLQQLSIDGKHSLGVNFMDIYSFNEALAKALIHKPHEYLHHASNGAYEQLRIEDAIYAETLEDVDLIIRVSNLLHPEPLRTLGADQLNRLIMVEGIIVRATPVRPCIQKAAFKCKKCGTMNMVNQVTDFIRGPAQCVAPDCGKSGASMFEFVQEESMFIDSQDLRLQERPEDLPPGQLPRTLAVKVMGKDLVELARPGDHCSVVGIPRPVAHLLPGSGKPRTFTMQLEALSLEVLGKEQELVQPTAEDQEVIKKLAEDPFIHRKIVSSLAPSIYGTDDVKEAMAYLLFGGVPKHLKDVNVRGEVNVLVIGDPGVAKSQLLEYIPRVAPRGLCTSGRGTTAAGLTAAVMHDKFGGMTLEAGALVLADKGICAIDEFDKMRAEDRTAIHSVMEQHKVSIAKGGIIATLNARTAILAAANPSLGRYEPCKTLTENVNLPITILSRFDLIFVIIDTPDKILDEKKATHILEIHSSHNTPVEPAIEVEMLRKYIAYAKTIVPKLGAEATKILKDFYLQMRNAGENNSEQTPIAITARQLESLVRLAEARARMQLRTVVSAEDAGAAINIMKRSLEQVGIDSSSMKIDIDLIMTGKPKSVRDKMIVVMDTLSAMFKANGPVPREELVNKIVEEHKLPKGEVEKMVFQLLRDGSFFEPREGCLART